MLSPFYIGTRYPEFDEELTGNEVKEVLRYAEKIAKFVKKKVK